MSWINELDQLIIRIEKDPVLEAIEARKESVFWDDFWGVNGKEEDKDHRSLSTSVRAKDKNPDMQRTGYRLDKV